MTTEAGKDPDVQVGDGVDRLLAQLERRLAERQSASEILIADKIEKRLEERNSSRNRYLTIGVTIAGLLGAGIVRETITSAASNAVDTKIAVSMKQIEYTKKYMDFTRIAQKISAADSFDVSDRVAAVGLLRELSKDEQTRSEPGFMPTLASFIDNMFSSGNMSDIDEICDLYKTECLSNPGIVQSLIIAYGRHLLGQQGTDAEHVKQTSARFNIAYERAKGETRGNANAYKALWLFKSGNAQDRKDLDAFIAFLNHMPEDQADGFRSTIDAVSKLDSLVKDSSRAEPEDYEIVNVAQRFLAAYGPSLTRAGILPRADAAAAPVAAR